METTKKKYKLPAGNAWDEAAKAVPWVTQSAVNSTSQSMSNSMTWSSKVDPVVVPNTVVTTPSKPIVEKPKIPWLSASWWLKPAWDAWLDNVASTTTAKEDNWVTMSWDPKSIKVDAPDKIDPTTGKMYNADGTDYVPGPNSTINQNTDKAGVNIWSDIVKFNQWPTDIDKWYSDIIGQISKDLWVTDPWQFDQTYWSVFSNNLYRQTYEALITNPNLTDVQKEQEIIRFKNNMLSAAQSLKQTKEWLNMLDATDEAIRSKFTNADEILANKKTIEELSKAGKTNDQIAQQTGKSVQEVQDYLLWNYGKYGNLTESALKEDKWYQSLVSQKQYLTDAYNAEIQSLQADKAEVKRQYDLNHDEQVIANKKQQLWLAELARVAGVSFTNTGMAGMAEVSRQAKLGIDEMYNNYQQTDRKLTEAINSRTLAYQQNDKQIVAAMTNQIDQIRNGFMWQITAIRNKYGEVSAEWIQIQRQLTNDLLQQIDTAVNNAYDQKQKNLNGLITATNYVRSELEWQAKETERLVNDYINTYDDKSYSDLLADVKAGKITPDLLDKVESWVKESIIGTLNSMKWFESYMIGSRFIDQIEKMYTEQGMNPQQIMSKILQDPSISEIVRQWQLDQKYGDIYMENLRSQNSMWLEAMRQSGDYNLQLLKDKKTSGWPVTSSISSDKMSTALTNAYNKCIKDGKQCGEFVNDYLQDLGVGRMFGNEYSQKKGKINSNTPVQWSVAIMPSPLSPEFWHVAVVRSVNGDGTVTVSEANWSGKEQYGERVVKMSDIDGYYVPGIQQSAVQANSLDEVLKNSDLWEGTKTTLSKIKWVMQAIETLAANTSDWNIQWVWPWVAFDAFSSDKSIANRWYLNAVNLMVQQWASGASLTEQQIKAVNKLVPDTYDTDATVRAKINNLRNFMNDQVKATLSVNGVDYTPEVKDLWPTVAAKPSTTPSPAWWSPWWWSAR